MGSFSVEVINEKDYQMVLAVLKALADNKIIRVEETDNFEDCIALPGPPLTSEQWEKYIENAEKGPFFNEEEMKGIFKYFKTTQGKLEV
jgi:hypothetical protein